MNASLAFGSGTNFTFVKKNICQQVCKQLLLTKRNNFSDEKLQFTKLQSDAIIFLQNEVKNFADQKRLFYIFMITGFCIELLTSMIYMQLNVSTTLKSVLARLPKFLFVRLCYTLPPTLSFIRNTWSLFNSQKWVMNWIASSNHIDQYWSRISMFDLYFGSEKPEAIVLWTCILWEIEYWPSTTTVCPVDGQPLTIGDLKPPSRLLRNLLDKLIIK